MMNALQAATPEQMRALILILVACLMILMMVSLAIMLRVRRYAVANHRNINNLIAYLKYIYGDAARSAYPPEK